MKVQINPATDQVKKPLSLVPPNIVTASLPATNRLFSRLPILQFGKRYQLGALISLELHFDLIHTMPKLKIQYRSGNGAWRTRKVSEPTKIEIDGVPERYHFSARLIKLLPGQDFEYIVLSGKETIFGSKAKAPPAKDQPFRLAITGDIGDGGPGSRRTAAALYNSNPDAVLLTGDIVYEHGRDSEYEGHFLSIYNAEEYDPEVGAPLLRSRVTGAAVGNHDMGFPSDEKRLDLNRRPDLLGYFLVWHHPENGPDLSRKKIVQFYGKKGKRDRLLNALGADFLSKVNFFLDIGNTHVTVIDANKYMDWTSADLRSWLKNELSQAHASTWKIVIWHQPPFNCDAKYHTDERMAVVSDILEQHNVDFVFHGHCHFYERNYPIRVTLDGTPRESTNEDGTVNGTIHLDKDFDGVTNTTPNGIIYVVTGAGGHPASDDHMPIEQPFAAVTIAERNSFTLLDINGGTAILRQMSVDGEELDKITVTKQVPDESTPTPVATKGNIKVA